MKDSIAINPGAWIVIFDGVCNFCNGSVNFIIQRDPGAKFQFAPIQGNVAQQLMQHYDISESGAETFILIKDDRYHVRTDAALEIAQQLKQPWPLFVVLRWVPRVIRDYCYTVFAKNRYALFGKRDVCMLPTADVRSRFLE